MELLDRDLEALIGAVIDAIRAAHEADPFAPAGDDALLGHVRREVNPAAEPALILDVLRLLWMPQLAYGPAETRQAVLMRIRELTGEFVTEPPEDIADDPDLVNQWHERNRVPAHEAAA
ncbi:hypothetical protein [Nocardia sp. NPDC050435]|uniref:hypothetical protein n=1 Tax=Nocardia sp. NPDC050435 TaxID=3155040 RepID=UPI0033FB14E3